MSEDKKQRKLYLIIMIAAAVVIVIAAAYILLRGFAGSRRDVADDTKTTAEDSIEEEDHFTVEDLDGSWSREGAAYITLMGGSAEVDGNGAYYSEGSVYIMQSGRYVLSGTLDNGSITVKADKSSEIYILLDSVNINCDDNAAIKVEKAGKVYLTLAEGSDNSIAAGEEYSEAAQNDNITAALFSRDDLTINGNGTLEVKAGYKHGIVAKDNLMITGGVIRVSAPGDGIRANDSLCICNADITAEAGDDGVVLNHSDGYFYMESGNLDIASADDAIHAGGDVTAAGGNITISSGDDGIHSDTMVRIKGGALTISESYEGIEAVIIEISGGETLIYAEDDGINANGGADDMFGQMPGGGPGNAGGHGMRSPSDNSVSGNMPGPPPGMDMPGVSGNRPGMPAEWNREKISGNGFDGGRSEGISGNKGGEKDNSDEEDEETYIKISGGDLTIINDSGQDADGIDSNGDIIITGGNIRVSLVNNGNNCALDCASESGGVAEISGGTIVACGNYSMAEQFDRSSSQVSLLYTYSEGAAAGTRVALEDKKGNVLIEYEVPQAFSSVNISCPELKKGETYVVVIGDHKEEIKAEEVSSSYGDAVGGGFGRK